MQAYTIGQLSKSVGVPTSTLRFYERRRLLTADARSRGNYRQYGEPALDRLRFIRSAQATGFSLADIRELLSLIHSDEPPCNEVVALTRNRLRDVRQRLGELRRVERVLAGALESCCKGSAPDLCEEITRLQGGRKTGRGAPCQPACRRPSPCAPQKNARRA